MGTILMMTISRHFNKMLFCGRRMSPYLEELQDGSRYQSGFFAGKCFFIQERWWYLDDLVCKNGEVFSIVEVSEMWDGDASSYKKVCYLRKITTSETIENSFLFDLSDQLWEFSLYPGCYSKYREKTGGHFPYYTLSIILFTDDLAIRKRTTSPAESVSMVLGNLPKYVHADTFSIFLF